MDIEWIRARAAAGEYVWSLHADEERRNDGFDIADVETALERGTVLETYPEDRRGRSCLVYGESRNRPIHIVCGRTTSDQLVIITVYQPTPPKWVTPTVRSQR